MADPRAIYEVEFPNARAVSSRFARAGARLEDVMIEAMEVVEDDGMLEFERQAPEDTGRLIESLDTELREEAGGGATLTFTADAVDDAGFDYLDLTRYGHRVLTIFPKQSKALKVHYDGHRNPDTFRYRPNVARVEVWSDWVQDAANTIRGRSVRAARRKVEDGIRTRVLG